MTEQASTAPAQPQRAWHALPPEAVLEALTVDAAAGLRGEPDFAPPRAAIHRQPLPLRGDDRHEHVDRVGSGAAPLDAAG